MTRAKQTIPHAWQTQEVDMSGVVANRNANKGQFQKQEGFSLTYLPYVMAAPVTGPPAPPEGDSPVHRTGPLRHAGSNPGVPAGRLQPRPRPRESRHQVRCLRWPIRA